MIYARNKIANLSLNENDYYFRKGHQSKRQLQRRYENRESSFIENNTKIHWIQINNTLPAVKKKQTEEEKTKNMEKMLQELAEGDGSDNETKSSSADCEQEQEQKENEWANSLIWRIDDFFFFNFEYSVHFTNIFWQVEFQPIFDRLITQNFALKWSFSWFISNFWWVCFCQFSIFYTRWKLW